MAASSFELLAKPIQHVLWDMQWRELRPIQVDAIQTALTSDDDMLICARTASGKTEAAFLPVLSRIFDEPGDSVSAIYVGPLKALINDQFRRLEVLCERAEIPVHRWHGDVDGSKKEKLLKDPRGVMLITPESLESFFVNRASSLKRVFADLRYVVIDEIHSLVGRERGLQLRSQLFRLRRYTKNEFQIFGLSATIGDAVPIYQSWMRPNDPNRVRHIQDPGEQKRIQFGIHVFPIKSKFTESNIASATVPDSHECEDETPAEMTQEILQHFGGQKNLMFCNSRGAVESLADRMNEVCRQFGRPEEFLVHHGSVSKELRQFAEESMRGARPSTIICSSTMEMGIDIGSVVTVGQVGACRSVNSLVQRLGRSGRRDGEPHRMRVMLPLREQKGEADFVSRIYPELLQAIALMELARQRWVEPPHTTETDYSTLVQQVLSILAEHGGTKAATLFTRLVAEGAFKSLDSQTFANILRCLGQRGWIEQMDDGTLILSPKGELAVHDLEFYSAFVSAQELTVRYESREIGKLSAVYVPEPGDHFLLAGRRWETLEVDKELDEVRVRPATGRKPPKYAGGGGEIHPRVRMEMKRVIEGMDDFGYLSPTAKQFLATAREVYHAQVDQSSSFLELADNKCLWLTWTGTRVQRTLMFLAKSAGIQCHDEQIGIIADVRPEEFIAVLVNYCGQLKSPEQLVANNEVTPWRKFDEYLDSDILRRPFVEEYLDLDGARVLIQQALGEFAAFSLDDVFRNWEVRKCPIIPSDNRVLDAPLLAPRPSEPDLPLGSWEIVAFDLETTGFSPRFARIVEIGAVKFRLGEVQSAQFQSLVDPQIRIPMEAQRVHGISNEMVRGQPPIQNVLRGFIQFVQSHPVLLLAHNARFDQQFLAAAAARLQIELPSIPIVDTLSLAETLVDDAPDYKLVSLVRHLGGQVSSAHRSIADSQHVKFIFEKMVRDRGIRAFHEISSLGSCFSLRAN